MSAWLDRFSAALNAGDIDGVAALFEPDGFWRDLVAFTWNIRTLEGRDAIAAMLRAQLGAVGACAFSLAGAATQTGDVTEAFIDFETAQARGRGIVRLRGGLCHTLLTSMTELKGFEEPKGRRRPKGIVHGARRDRTTWLEERERETRELGRTRQPYCLIIGGGQGGIALAARLRQLNVPAIVVEKNARAGDSWRNRYRSLVLHDPVWYDHLPYIPFPDNWPVFTPKDKMGDWLEMYVKAMEIDYWGATECRKAVWNHEAKEWAVTVLRDGEEIVLRPRQLVFATGSYGPPREIDLPGAERFAGTQYHSCHHVSAAPFTGRKAVVVGANSSAHDICADLWENGAAEITMIQRSPTTVARSETLMEVAFAPIYSQEAVDAGIDTDRADLIFASTPFRLMADAQRPVYAEIARRDADLIARLSAAGFRTDYAEDCAGLMAKALRSGSGYYIDVGCSELIASGQVKVVSGVEPVALTENAVVLNDGREIRADVVVYATGYRPMNEWVANIVSREAADMIGPNWGYGSGFKGDPGPWEGELRNMWKPLTHEPLWF
ncbi:MAG TPA: NAD(P)/FAD-dependent oxidoreductase, partial [Rhizobiaceae bacterium]|nr:NAD(P)/FAD-dependent oxidoreductase [Rhizobiaceae bacterium]